MNAPQATARDGSAISAVASARAWTISAPALARTELDRASVRAKPKPIAPAMSATRPARRMDRCRCWGTPLTAEAKPDSNGIDNSAFAIHPRRAGIFDIHHFL